MADNVELQISALKRLWRRQLAMDPAQITTEQLMGYAAGAGAVMIDGSEVIRVQFTDGGTDAVAMYPKYAVMHAALDVLDEADPLPSKPDGSVVHADLSRTPIET